MIENNISEMISQSALAFDTYSKTTISKRAAFLLSIVASLEQIKEQIISTASEESNLAIGRINNEYGRTVNQIKLFADYIKEGSYLEATIDYADPDRQPMPKSDIRRMLVPLGPVVIFGASNFPLAFSTIGGDTVSALASGCTVLYKCHPGHPRTSKLVSGAIAKALEDTGLPEDTFIHMELDNEESQAVVMHPLVEGIGFTGSYKAGKLIYDLTQKREKPIPVYAEMGSVNPIFLLEKKSEINIEELALKYANSLTLGVGQFCTNPGIIFIPERVKDTFVNVLSTELSKVIPQAMLTSQIAHDYHRKLKNYTPLNYGHGAYVNENLASPAIKIVEAETWVNEPKYHEEVFGPYGLVITYGKNEDLDELIKGLEGQLTITLWATEEELVQNKWIMDQLQRKCGRLLFKGVPTGVEVGYAMQHGGPFPATTDSRSTSVGIYAIKRFLKPIAFQDCPEILLPEELQSENPLAISRLENGKYIIKK